MCDTQISVHKTYLFVCVIHKEVPNPYQCTGQSMMSLWLVSIHDRRGSIQQTDTAEMKNVNTKCKTESDIFKDWLSTLGELRNPKEMNMHFGRFFSARMKSKQNYELIHWNVSKLPSVHILVNANLDIHTISVNNNSVQQNVRFSKTLSIWFP
jgi:hypothetical protein